MYTPTPEETGIYGLSLTQWRFFMTSEICAGIFRANSGRKCKAELTFWWDIEGIIYCDDEGDCYIVRDPTQKNTGNMVFIYTADKESKYVDQIKINTLTIYPEEKAEEAPEEKQPQDNTVNLGATEFPIPAEAVVKILKAGPRMLKVCKAWFLVIQFMAWFLILFTVRMDHVFIAAILFFIYGHIERAHGMLLCVIRMLFNIKK